MDIMEGTKIRIRFKIFSLRVFRYCGEKRRKKTLWDLHSLTYSQLTQT